MKRKGISEKRIGPEVGSRERSIRKRHIKVTEQALNAAERSALWQYECFSVRHKG